MKKAVLIVLGFVFALQMSAQINEPGKFYITPKVGYNLANITLLDEFGADPRHGIFAGIAGEYAFNEMISVEPGIFYSMHGSAFNISSFGKVGLNSDYVTVPVLLKVYVADGFHLFAGPQLGYMVSSRFKLKTGNTLIDVISGIVSKNIDLTKYQNQLDVSIVVGLGYQFANGFNISANYNLGMAEVPDMPDITWNDKIFTLDLNAKNRVLQVGIGYRF